MFTKGGNQVARDGAGLAVAYRASVKLHGGDDFGGGSGEEYLVGVVNIVLGDDRLGHGVA